MVLMRRFAPVLAFCALAPTNNPTKPRWIDTENENLTAQILELSQKSEKEDSKQFDVCGIGGCMSGICK